METFGILFCSPCGHFLYGNVYNESNSLHYIKLNKYAVFVWFCCLWNGSSSKWWSMAVGGLVSYFRLTMIAFGRRREEGGLHLRNGCEVSNTYVLGCERVVFLDVCQWSGWFRLDNDPRRPAIWDGSLLRNRLERSDCRFANWLKIPPHVWRSSLFQSKRSSSHANVLSVIKNCSCKFKQNYDFRNGNRIGMKCRANPLRNIQSLFENVSPK